MSKILYIILWISNYFIFTNGQYVESMPPQDTCVPASLTLHCSTNYTVIVRTASYGVTQTSDSCSYTPGDCIVDAMNIITCFNDSSECSIYATNKKLSQCNDQQSSYFHVEYDCVPIFMNDSSNVYNICQNDTDITTDHGIIQTPGYPTPFQATTVECIHEIRVPNIKTIRLWLTDLYIGSTSTNCADDHVYVVDNVQTFKHCGRQRYAYPYLCSSTILIQYLATTDFPMYRGMRIYFEFIDRPLDDTCPKFTVTPIPMSTTTVTTIEPGTTTGIPIYVQLGIASPRQSFQLCSGESTTIECPNNYVIAIITNVYGVTTSNQCESHDANNDCVVTTDKSVSCRQTCSFHYIGNEIISSCNGTVAAYQYVEYQCIPTNTNLISPNTTCPTDGSKTVISFDRNGRFQSYNYPNLTQMNCIYRLTTKPGHIIHIYALDISLNNLVAACQTNLLTFIEDDEEQGTNFCEQRMYSLIYSSCSNELDLRYVIDDASQMSSNGIDLYIESQTRPDIWRCGEVLPTSTIPTTPQITPTTPQATSISSNSSMIALAEVDYDICFNETLNYACPFGYTFMIIAAYYGVKSETTSKCGFVENDCLQEATSTITQCHTDSPNCYLSYSNKRRLAQCSDQYADYLHLIFQCVPSFPVGSEAGLNVYDVCDTSSSIQDLNGIITSPNFPNFTQTNDQCKRDMFGVHDRLLKVWLNEMSISSGGQRSSTDINQPDLIIYKTNEFDDIEQMSPSVRDTCINDYFMLDTRYIAYIYCGTRKLSLAPICTSSATIQYKTTTPQNSNYKGFKLYFEWIEKPMDVICQGTPATIDPSASTTTPENEPLPIWAQNLDVSPILSKHICLGAADSIKCPRSNDYLIAIRDSTYAVTGTGLCEVPSSSHCFQKASLSLTCTHTCLIDYIVPKLLSQCQNQTADYLDIDYECVPTRLVNSENPIDICSSTTTDTIAINKGLITSPQYPSLNSAYSCSKTIETLPSKLWMIYIIDLFLEAENDYGDCLDASLTINDGDDIRIICGLQQPQLVLTSCSNIVQFDFLSSHQALGYRGFKIFFKTIDIPNGWSCTPSGFTTTTQQTTIPTSPATTLIPPSLQIATYGGTTTPGIRQYCQFPFTYQGSEYTKCITDKPPNTTVIQTDSWCSLTSHYETDLQWGFCDIGVTDSTFLDICRSQSQRLRCSDGYVIKIVTADYAAKQDGTTSCIYDQTDCLQSDISTMQNVCAGKTTCTAYHISKTLASCQNRLSAYLHIEYTCVPDAVPSINTYVMCNSDSKLPDDIRRGFLISPNFPNTESDLNCTYDIQTSKPRQNIYIYIIEMNLNDPNNLGQSCTKDRFIVQTSNTIKEWCGLSYTTLILKTCHTSVSLQLIRSTDAKGRGVKLYFEFRDRSPDEICEDIVTPSPPSTVTSTPTGSTTMPSRPDYFPNPSSRMFNTLCYPDVSGSFGANNFQCPLDYVIVIHRAFYGKGNRCDYTPGDCISEADEVYQICSGKQACSISFENIVTLSQCDQATAEYLSVEYQCLPTLTIAQSIDDICSNQTIELSEISGILQSTSYPSYTQKECMNVTLIPPVGSNLVIYMYLLDLDIGPLNVETGQCSDDYLLLSYQCNNQLYNLYFCGTRQTELLFDTCSATDQIFASYNLTSQNSQSQRGFALLYHLLPKSTISTSSPSPGPGPLSTMISQSIVCVQDTMRLHCDPYYIIVSHKIDFAVSKTGSCNYSSDDCFEEHINSNNLCSGKPSCPLFASLIPLSKCNNTMPNYLYAEYQCIPTQPKFNFNICSPPNPIEKVDGGAIISSEGYILSSDECTINLESAKISSNPSHKAFSVYIVMINLPIRSFREQGLQCNDNDPYIEIEDSQMGITRLCGNSHTRKLFETCSTTIEIRYRNFNSTTNPDQYKGFRLYIESIEKQECSEVSTITPPIPQEPFVITEQIACSSLSDRERVSLSCTPDYGLVFLQSYEFIINDPLSCDLTQQTCHFLSEQPQALCSGQQSCTYIHSNPTDSQLNMCQSNRSDLIQFYSQCIPMTPTSTYPKATFCADTDVTFDRGFIETPNYPNSYQDGPQQCSLRIPLPNNTEDQQLSVYLYIIDLSILDTSKIDPTLPIQCYDSITYQDGNTTRSLCGNIDQPIFEYKTNKTALELILNLTESLPSNISSDWHGARFFVLIGNQSLPSPPPPPGTITTTKKPNQPDKSDHGPMIAGIIVSVFVIVIISIAGYLYYRRRQSSSNLIEVPTMEFTEDGVTMVDNANNKQSGNPSSIPSAAFGKQASSPFNNPYFKVNLPLDDTDA